MIQTSKPSHFPECEGATLPRLLSIRAEKSAASAALWELDEGNSWEKTTWGDFLGAVRSLSIGLQELGLQRGDRIGIMMASSREWDIAQLAITAAGGVAVGLDPHGLDEHTQAISLSCNLAGIVLTNASMAEKLGSAVLSELRFKIALESPTPEHWLSFNALLKAEKIEGSWDLAEPDAIATIIFTSGTTGAPKGIAYSHRQICQAIASILSAFPDIREGSHLVCWLPLSNLFQRIINFCAIERGAETFYVRDPREVMRFAPSVAPHVFIAVPRFYEKLFAGIQASIAVKPAWQKYLIDFALRVGHTRAVALRANSSVSLGTELQFLFADKFVLRKLRELLGPNLKFLISGSAPMPKWLLERFHAMGLLILEAYGLSENVIPVALNRPDCFRFGTVGQALAGCEVRFADDGELLVRGPGVFSGYLGEPGEHSPVEADGFLHSGDFATIDEDGFISLVGRKADIFKTSTGRRIAPSPIEALLRQISQVDQVVVFGARRPQPVALLSILPEAWDADPQRLSDKIRAQVRSAISVLPTYLHPAGLVITAQTMSIGGGELTANLKLRRNNVESKYALALEHLYSLLDTNLGSAFASFSSDGIFLYCSL